MCPCAQVCEAVPDMSFLNCRPSVVAAAVLYVERRARGAIPFWPSMLAKLTGYKVRGAPRQHDRPRVLSCHTTV